MSEEVTEPEWRTEIRPFSSSQTRVEPGPTPRRLRTSAGRDICPWAVILDCAISICSHYRSNGVAALGAAMAWSPREARCAVAILGVRGTPFGLPRSALVEKDLSVVRSILTVDAASFSLVFGG